MPYALAKLAIRGIDAIGKCNKIGRKCNNELPKAIKVNYFVDEANKLTEIIMCNCFLFTTFGKNLKYLQTT